MTKMIRAMGAALVFLASITLASAQSAKPHSPHDIAEASRLIAEKREACRLEAKAQNLSIIQRRKYRLACLKR